MTKYTLAVQSEILCLENDGAWILDTGSPFSVGRRDRLVLDGMEFPIRQEMLGIDMDRIVELPGIEAEGLLGADILNHFTAVLSKLAGGRCWTG